MATAVETRTAPARPSDEQWRGIWLRKLDKSLDDLKVDNANTARYHAIVERFLVENHGPPVAVADSAVRSFLSKIAPEQKQTAAETLLYFYKNVVRSENHAKFLSSAQNFPDKPAPAADTLLEKLSRELRLRNYSRRTVKNYCAIVKNFLAGLQGVPAGNAGEEIKKYQLLLKERKNYSPRTINLATAALSFFYNTVLNRPVAAEQLPRMKTGRQLPKVELTAR